MSLRTIVSEYTTVSALLVLCALLSVITWGKQFPAGASGGKQVAGLIQKRSQPGASVLIVVRTMEEDAEFAAALAEGLKSGGFRIVETVRGQPVDARRAIVRANEAGAKIDWVAGSEGTA